MLEIKNLTKRYGDLTVYDNFNLCIDEGKVLVVLGESGSGKTTLLNCIAGLTEFSGSMPKQKCSYVFQSPRLVPCLTVRENLKLICKDERDISNMLCKVHLEDKAEMYVGRLSAGQAERVSIARAFLYDGDVMLLDEPFASLDFKLKNEIVALFLSIREENNKTAICVTHDIDTAICIAHRIIIIGNGKINCDIKLDDAPPRDICRCENIRSQIISALA